jgi:hypothetical protein
VNSHKEIFPDALDINFVGVYRFLDVSVRWYDYTGIEVVDMQDFPYSTYGSSFSSLRSECCTR